MKEDQLDQIIEVLTRLRWEQKATTDLLHKILNELILRKQ